MAKKKQTQDELEELDQAYARITGYKPKYQAKRQKNPAKRICICIALVLLLALGGLFLFSANYGSLLDGMLKMKAVTIGGISMGGMTKAEAKQALGEVSEKLHSESMVIQVLDSTLSLSPVYTQIQPDADEAVNAAFREGATGVYDWTAYLGLNTDIIRSAADTLGKQYNTSLSQTTAVVTGQRPPLEANAAPSDQGMVLSITVGSPEYGLDTDALYRQILDAYSGGVLTVTGVCSILPPEMPDLDALYAQYYVAPVDAVMDPKTFQISPDSYGYHFDLESVKEALSNAEYGETLEFPFRKITPDVTAATLSSTLFCDVLGSAKTPYKGLDTNNRNTNLALACEAINNVILLPGETFSYNQTLGKRTKEAGYKEAPSYAGGLTVDTLGGGICQVSSTLYYSTLFADLEIVERHNHSYVSDYIDKGMDATVTWDGADFCFSNNTDFPIRIEAWRADGYVNVRIIGTDQRDYYVKMSYKVRQHTPYETVYEEYPADNPEKYTDGKEIVTPYDGYVVQTYKEKYSKETDELLSSEKWTYDTYKKRDRVICKIVDTPSTEAAQ